MWRVLAAGAAAVCLSLTCSFEATAQPSCAAADFGRAVDQAGAKLRAFNLESAPKVQARLTRLAEQKKWPEDAREGKTQEFLRDPKIASLDETASELVAKVDDLGRSAEGGKPPDCAKLQELEAAGLELLAVMKTKAAYTNDKIDAALGDSSSPAPVAEAPRPAPPPAEAPKAPPPGKKPPVAEKKPAPKPKGDEPKAVARADDKDKRTPASRAPTDSSSWTATTELDPSVQNPSGDYAPPGVPYVTPSEDGYTIDEIREASRGFFGAVSSNLGSVIEYAFSKSGRPTAYILGTEGGGAFLAGVRYGSGTLFLHRGEEEKIYWTGPSLGTDVGAEGSRTMFLIYNVSEPGTLYRRFTGVDGSAYFVGGVGITFLKGGEVILAPIRSGLGFRIGANLGYLRFTPEKTWNPF